MASSGGTAGVDRTLEGLTTTDLDRLRRYFDEHNGILTESQFVLAAACSFGFVGSVSSGVAAARSTADKGSSITLAPVKKLADIDPTSLAPDIVAMLQQLFSRADRDDVGEISWSDLSTALLPPTRESEGLLRASTEEERGKYAFLERTDLTVIEPQHNSAVGRVRMLHPLGIMAVCIENKTTVALYRLLDRYKMPSDGLRYLGEIDTFLTEAHPGGQVLDVAFLRPQNLLILAIADFSLQIWDINDFLTRLRINPGAVDALQFPDGLIPSHVGYGLGLPKNAEANRKLDADGSVLYAGRSLPDSSRGPAINLAGRGATFVSRIHTSTQQRVLLYVPEPEKLLSADSSGAISVWHTHAKRVRGVPEVLLRHKGTLTVHTRAVLDMILMPDIGLLASAGLDDQVVLWGVRHMPDGIGGRRGVHGEATMSVFSSGGRAAPGFYMHKSFTHSHSRGVRSLTYLPSVRYLVSAGWDTYAQVYDMIAEDGVPAYRLKGHAAALVNTIAIEPIDQQLVTVKMTTLAKAGGAGGGLPGVGGKPLPGKGLRATTEAEAKSKAAHVSQILTLDEDGEVRWWTLSRTAGVMDTERCLQAFQPLLNRVFKVEDPVRCLIPVRLLKLRDEDGGGDSDDEPEPDDADPLDAEKLANMLTGGKRAHDAPPPGTLEDVFGEFGSVFGAADALAATRRAAQNYVPISFSGVGKHVNKEKKELRRRQLLSKHYDGACVLVVSDARWTCFEAVCATLVQTPISSLCYHPTRNMLTCITQRDVRMLDVPSAELRVSQRYVLASDAVPGCIAMDEKGRRLFLGCGDGTLLIVDGNSGLPLRKLPSHTSDVTGLAYVDRDGLVLSVGMDGLLQICDERLNTLYARMAEDSARGSRSVPRDFDAEDEGAARARNITLRSVSWAHGDGVQVSAMAFQYDASLIATGAVDGSVRVWDYQRVALLAWMTGHEAEITAVAWCPPYPILVTADYVGTVNVWRVTRTEPPVCLATFTVRSGVKLLRDWNFARSAPPKVASVGGGGGRRRASLSGGTPGSHPVHRLFKTTATTVAAGGPGSSGTGVTEVDPVQTHLRTRLRLASVGFPTPITTLAYVPGAVEARRLALSRGGYGDAFEATRAARQKTRIRAAGGEAEPGAGGGGVPAAPRARAGRPPAIVIGDPDGNISWWSLAAVLEGRLAAVSSEGDVRVVTGTPAAGASLLGTSLPLHVPPPNEARAGGVPQPMPPVALQPPPAPPPPSPGRAGAGGATARAAAAAATAAAAAAGPPAPPPPPPPGSIMTVARVLEAATPIYPLDPTMHPVRSRAYNPRKRILRDGRVVVPEPHASVAALAEIDDDVLIERDLLAEEWGIAPEQLASASVTTLPTVASLAPAGGASNNNKEGSSGSDGSDGSSDDGEDGPSTDAAVKVASMAAALTEAMAEPSVDSTQAAYDALLHAAANKARPRRGSMVEQVQAMQTELQKDTLLMRARQAPATPTIMSYLTGLEIERLRADKVHGVVTSSDTISGTIDSKTHGASLGAPGGKGFEPGGGTPRARLGSIAATAASAVKPKKQQQDSSANKPKFTWVGKPVRTMRVVNRPELQILATGGDDGYICVFALDGTPLGRISAASGSVYVSAAVKKAEAVQAKEAVAALGISEAFKISWAVPYEKSFGDEVRIARAKLWLEEQLAKKTRPNKSALLAAVLQRGSGAGEEGDESEAAAAAAAPAAEAPAAVEAAAAAPAPAAPAIISASAVNTPTIAPALPAPRSSSPQKGTTLGARLAEEGSGRGKVLSQLYTPGAWKKSLEDRAREATFGSMQGGKAAAAAAAATSPRAGGAAPTAAAPAEAAPAATTTTTAPTAPRPAALASPVKSPRAPLAALSPRASTLSSASVSGAGALGSTLGSHAGARSPVALAPLSSRKGGAALSAPASTVLPAAPAPAPAPSTRVGAWSNKADTLMQAIQSVEDDPALLLPADRKGRKGRKGGKKKALAPAPAASATTRSAAALIEQVLAEASDSDIELHDSDADSLEGGEQGRKTGAGEGEGHSPSPAGPRVPGAPAPAGSTLRLPQGDRLEARRKVNATMRAYDMDLRAPDMLTVDEELRRRNPGLMEALERARTHRIKSSTFKSMGHADIVAAATGIYSQQSGIKELEEEERHEDRLVRAMALSVIADIGRGDAPGSRKAAGAGETEVVAEVVAGAVGIKPTIAVPADDNDPFGGTAGGIADAQRAAMQTAADKIRATGYPHSVLKAVAKWTMLVLRRRADRAKAAAEAAASQGATLALASTARSGKTGGASGGGPGSPSKVRFDESGRGAGGGRRSPSPGRRGSPDKPAKPPMRTGGVAVELGGTSGITLEEAEAQAASRARARKFVAALTNAVGARARYYKRQHRASKALSSFMGEHLLTPEQFRVLNKKAKIGGELRRDVLSFRNMLARVDPERSGRVAFETFIAEIEKGHGGLQFMKRQLEAIFRGVDKEGTGSLPVADFAKVIFPRAEAEQLKVIVAFCTYQGPDPDQVKVDFLHRAGREQLELLRELFDEYDADKGGTVDRSELQAAFKAMGGGGRESEASRYDPSAMMSSGVSVVDEVAAIFGDGDGELTFNEFVDIIGPFFIDDE